MSNVETTLGLHYINNKDNQPLKDIINNSKTEQNHEYYLQNGFSQKNENLKDFSQDNSKSL